MAKTKRQRRSPQQILADEKARLELQAVRMRKKFLKEQEKLLSSLSTHKGASKDRLFADWNAKGVTADRAIISDSVTLNARARQIVRDEWIGPAALSGKTRNIVGTGITAVSAAIDPETKEPLTDFNEALDEEWNYWVARKNLVDIEKRKTFTACQNLTVRELYTVGEAFIIPSIIQRPGQSGLVLQFAEPEQLNVSLYQNKDNGNEIRGGVEIDEYGAAVAFHFLNATTFSQYSTKSIRIPADRVIHIFDPGRVRQTRAVTPWAPIMTKVRHQMMYEQFELIAARYQACIMAAVQSDPAATYDPLSLPLASGQSSTDATGNTLTNIEPGMVAHLNPGETVSWLTPNRPGDKYEPFTMTTTKQIAAAFRQGYHSLIRNSDGTTYASARQDLLEDYKETDAAQVLLITDLCTPIREQFILEAIMSGRIQAPRFFESTAWQRAYMKTEWRGPAKPWIDPTKEVSAAVMAIANRLDTHSRVLNEKGLSVREVLRSESEAEGIAEQLDLFMPTAGSGGSSGGTSTPPQDQQQSQDDNNQTGDNGNADEE